MRSVSQHHYFLKLLILYIYIHTYKRHRYFSRFILLILYTFAATCFYMCFSMRILYIDWSKVYDHEGFSSLFYCIGVIISELNCDFIILWFSASPWILKNLFFEGEASLKGIVVLFFFLSFIFFTFLFLVIQYIYIFT